MAKYLVHLAFPTWVIDNFIMYDTIVKLLKTGDEVHIFYCDGTIPVCFSNPCAEKAICKWCHWYRCKMNKHLPIGVKIHTFSEYYDPNLAEQAKQFSFSYNSIEDIKKLTYKNVQIGYGALSTYISQTRNLNPLIDADFKKFFGAYLNAQCLLTEFLDRALTKIKPDVVLLYNGRLFEVRPIYEYAKSLGYETRCYENIRPLGLKKGIYSVSFKNSLPLNIDYHTKLVESNWVNSSLSEQQKKDIGQSFFENRRHGSIAGDVVYTLNQTGGLLPDNWDKTKRNIVIFNSSEDEFVAVGDEYSRPFLFSNQLDGLHYILNLFKNNSDINFYLRIHPNLKNIKYHYHSNLYKLNKKYPNVTIIPPESKISSYSLLDNAEKIIVFGSTIGPEATYWGKPVILLAEAFYSLLDLCYIPQSLEELREMIIGKLEPKNNLPAIKYGFFIMNDKRGEPIENYNTGATVIKKKFFFFKYRPIRYSTVYLAVIKIFLILINKLLPNRKIKIPTQEAPTQE